MKTSNHLLALSAASAAIAASAASAAVVTYTGTSASASGWTAAANASAASNNGYVLPGAGTGSGGTYSWGSTATASGSGASATVSSIFYFGGFTFTAAGGSFVTTAGSVSFTAGAGGGSVSIVVGPNVWGAFFDVSSVSPNGISLTVDGQPVGGSPVNITGGTGTFGAVNTSAISGFLVNVAQNGTITFNNAGLLIVPTPGAVALLGVAGLVGTRRRR